jgi:hypothetical protein
LLAIIFCFALLVRFYNYEERITFGPEQAMSLITSGRMVTEKFTLLGNQNLLRATSAGHSLFAGAIFNYSLIPLQILFSYDPLPITVYFTLLNLFTGFVLYKVVNRMLGEEVALFSLLLFIFSGITIYHSLFIWNQNYAFILGTFAIYFLYLLYKEVKSKYILTLGLLSGIGYSFQDLYILSALIVLLIAFRFSKNKLHTTVVYAFGMMLPNLPAIIFDLRHDFYHLRTSFQFFIDTISGGSADTSLSYYHFLFFFPVVFVLAGLVVKTVFAKNKYLGIVVLTLYLYFNLNSSWVNFSVPTGMPKELTLSNIYKAAAAIAEETPVGYNVAVLVDFDTRGHVLRYPLEFKHKLKPLGVIEYPQSNRLYVLAENDHNFEKTNVWELSSFPINKIKLLSDISDNYSVFRLDK